MEDNFNVRVNRAFGSLESSSSSSIIPNTLSKSTASLSSLWCLSDQEIERKEWIRDKVTPLEDKDEDLLPHKKPKPYSSFLQGILASPKQHLADLESDIQELDDGDDDSEGEQPQPDDRSNEEWTIRSSVGMDCTLDNEEEEDAYDKVAVGKEDDESGLQLGVNLNSIMNDNGRQSKKKVVFDEESQDLSKVPDYIRNPSKYTHYTFDDSLSEDDEESNRKAYMDFFNMMKGSNAMETEDRVSSDFPTSIIFTPKKKKVSDGKRRSEDHVEKKVHVIAIAGDDDDDHDDGGEICAMDEDETEMATDKRSSSSSLQKAGRRYRTRG